MSFKSRKTSSKMKNVLVIKLFDNHCRKVNDIKINLCYIHMQIFFERYCKYKMNVKRMIIQYTYKEHQIHTTGKTLIGNVLMSTLLTTAKK